MAQVRASNGSACVGDGIQPILEYDMNKYFEVIIKVIEWFIGQVESLPPPVRAQLLESMFWAVTFAIIVMFCIQQSMPHA